MSKNLVILLLVFFITVVQNMGMASAQGDRVGTMKNGIEFGSKGLYREAEAEFTKVIQEDPRSYLAYYNRGFIYESQGRTAQAITDYSKSIEINPNYANAYNNRGIAYQHQGDYSRAVTDHSAAIEKDPRLFKAYYNRALAYEKLGRLDLAVRDYDQALAVNPRYDRAYRNRAVVLLRKNGVLRLADDFKPGVSIPSAGSHIFPSNEGRSDRAAQA